MHIRGFACGTAGYRVDYRTPMSRRAPPATPLPRDAHAPPPNGGFCTTRRIATACRRRVAPLMLQFPPFARGNHGPAGLPRQLHPATTRPNHGPARRHRPTQPPTPSHNAPLPTATSPTGPHPAAQRGFCTTRRTATACRRRVAPLMLQFPPLARANHHLARHQRRPTDPAAGGHPVRPTRPPTPDHTQPQRAPTNRNLARPATPGRPATDHRPTPGRLPARPPLTGPRPAAQRGVLHH